VVQPRGLVFLAVPGQAQPFQIAPDCVGVALLRAFRIGVVDAQNEDAARILARHGPVHHRGAQIADMQKPGRGRREPGGDHRARHENN
jgi:hypothetical protein